MLPSKAEAATKASTNTLNGQTISLTYSANGSYSVSLGFNNTIETDKESYSVAIGASNTASGQYDVAMGASNTASDFASVAVGFSNISSGTYSVAMGASNTASGLASVAMGSENTASGNYSVAMGNKNKASGSESVAMGNSNTASGMASVAMGVFGKSSEMASVAMGAFTNAKGMGGVAFGFGGIDTSTSSAKETVGAIGDGSFVTGGFVSFDEEEESFTTNPNTASGRNAVAMGEGNTASGIDSFAIGKGNTASGDYSVAMGQSATATPDNSFAFGGTVASGHTASVALGYGSVTGGAYEVSVGSSTQTRKITNVTAGTADTDAVNYSQVKGAYTNATYSGTTLTLTKIDGTQTQLTIGGGGGGGGSFFEADGNDVKLSTQSKITNVAAGTNAYDAVNYSQLKNLEGRLTQDIGRTGAASAALASLHPQMMRKGESQVMAGMGRYHGKSGAAVGLAWQPHKRVMLSGGFADAAGEIMFNVGASYKFGQHSYTPEQLVEMYNGNGTPLYVAEMNAALKSKDVQIMNLKSDNAAIKAELAELKAIVAELVKAKK